MRTLENFSKELKKIFALDFSYVALLLFFILMFYTLIYYDLPFFVQLFFLSGLLLIPSSYQQKIREVAELKMKFLYVKTKLSDRINDFEKILIENDSALGTDSIEKVLNELKMDKP